MNSPEPDQIKQARTEACLTQTQAAETIYCSMGAWKKWESGERQMHPAFWELFLIKTKQVHNAPGKERAVNETLTVR